MMPYRLVFKLLEIVLSTVFLVLCTKALFSHFYDDLRRLARSRRPQVGMIQSPSLIPAVEVSVARIKRLRTPPAR
jgi:hypothetical protein